MTTKPKDKPRRILEELQRRLDRSAQELTPWFYRNMPEYYLRTHSDEEQLTHLQAILAARALTERQAVVLKSPCGTRITAITPGGDLDVLIGVLEGLADKPIQTARLYSSRDRALRLDTFLLGPQPLCDPAASDFGAALKSVSDFGLVLPERREEFAAFLASASGDYVDKFEPQRAVRHFQTCGCLEGTEEVLVTLEPLVHPGLDRITAAMANPPETALLLLACKIFRREGVDVVRAYGDTFDKGAKGRMAVISFYVDHSRSKLRPEGARWARIARQLRLLKWFSFHGLENLTGKGFELREVQLLQAACQFARQVLGPSNPYAYSYQRICRVILDHADTARLLLDCFTARFGPGLGNGRQRAWRRRRDAARLALMEISDHLERAVLGAVLRFFHSTLRTNYFRAERTGLGFRLDPTVLAPLKGMERPFGLFFFHGPHSFGFHVRFADMARGGVRLVLARGPEQMEREGARLLSEASRLAQAQHLKNKDIPEGGAKAVILVGPGGDEDLALKATVDALLDLIVPGAGHDAAELGRLADYLGREEILYLGPDEHIEPRHIEWIVDRAEKRGYPWPQAFMSSKPRTGINHKEYGVTSEGVVVFAEEALRAVGLDPRGRSFTVKMTGGPGGDVASNAMRILHREFGDAARILAVTDGHGAAYDPAGLDHAELLRLADQSGHISGFDPGKLGGEGAFVVSAGTPEGVKQRDDLHNRVEADLFLPCGGRPDTMNAKNWSRYFLPDGRPSARVVVEAANLFFSPEARTRLEERGVLLVPGPSANKTGVICSSYEVLAALTLSQEEFLAVKPRFVQEVLAILRTRARDEARLLLSEYRLSGDRRPATAISRSISLVINRLTDVFEDLLVEEMTGLAEDRELRDLLLAYCPPVLAEEYPGRVLTRIPARHQAAILAASIASRLVYHEGQDWADGLLAVRGPREFLSAYLEQERRVDRLLRAVTDSDLPGREDLADIVRQAGRRLFTLKRMGLAFEPRNGS